MVLATILDRLLYIYVGSEWHLFIKSGSDEVARRGAADAAFCRAVGRAGEVVKVPRKAFSYWRLNRA